MQTLEAMATSNSSIISILKQQYGPASLSLARHFMTPQERKLLETLSTEDFDLFLDTLIQDLRDHGMVLWMYKKWYLEQMESLRKVLLRR